VLRHMLPIRCLDRAYPFAFSRQLLENRAGKRVQIAQVYDRFRQSGTCRKKIPTIGFMANNPIANLRFLEFSLIHRILGRMQHCDHDASILLPLQVAGLREHDASKKQSDRLPTGAATPVRLFPNKHWTTVDDVALRKGIVGLRVTINDMTQDKSSSRKNGSGSRTEPSRTSTGMRGPSRGRSKGAEIQSSGNGGSGIRDTSAPPACWLRICLARSVFLPNDSTWARYSRTIFFKSSELILPSERSISTQHFTVAFDHHEGEGVTGKGDSKWAKYASLSRSRRVVEIPFTSKCAETRPRGFAASSESVS